MTSQRERRSTAGKRMAALTGKALETDEAFWGHETWKDDEDDSGNESFHSSDEDSEVKKDVFDSDFNDSESDHEEEEQAEGDEQERELAREERKQRATAKRSYMDISSRSGAGRGTLKGKRGRGGMKRVMGDGINAGIVLNIPGNAPSLPAVTKALSVPGTAVPAVAKAPAQRSSRPKADSRLAMATTRPRRVNKLSKYSSRFRAARTDAAGVVAGGGSARTTSAPAHSATSSQKKRKRQRFTQQDLLLEAANETEPENARWLLGRKRIQDQSQKDQEGRDGRGAGSLGGLIVTERYSSRRGYLNAITFPEMDHVPDILTRSRSTAAEAPPAPTFCVITGLRARYRDPQTGQGYYDAKAFRELRRRHKAGEPLDRRAPPPAQRAAAQAPAVTAANRPASALSKRAKISHSSSSVNGDAGPRSIQPNGASAQQKATPLPPKSNATDRVRKPATNATIARKESNSVETKAKANPPTAITSHVKDSANPQNVSVQHPGADKTDGDSKTLSTGPRATSSVHQNKGTSSDGPSAGRGGAPDSRPRVGVPQASKAPPVRSQGGIPPAPSARQDSSTMPLGTIAPPAASREALTSRRASPRRRKPSAKVLENMNAAASSGRGRVPSSSLPLSPPQVTPSTKLQHNGKEAGVATTTSVPASESIAQQTSAPNNKLEDSGSSVKVLSDD